MVTKVIRALQKMTSLPGITVSEVRGFGRGRALNAADKVVHESVEYARKMKLEIVVPDSLAESVIATIRDNAWSGKAGDGKIFVMDVDDIIRIRTGEQGEEAI